MTKVKEEKLSIEERTKGLTLDEVKLKFVSTGLLLVKNQVAVVHESSLSAAQKELLKKALWVVDEIQETIDL